MKRILLLSVSIFFNLLVLAPFWGFIFLSTFNASYYNVLGFFVIILLIVICIIRLRTKSLIIPSYSKTLLAFVLYTMFSDIFIAEKDLNWFIYFTRYGVWLSFITIFIIENTYISASKFRYLIKNGALIILFSVFVSFTQQVINPLFLVSEKGVIELRNLNIISNRLPSIFSWLSPLDVGLTFVPLVSLILEVFLKDRKYGKGLFLYFIGFVVVFLNKSRWSIINYLILSFLFLHYRYFKPKHYIIIAGVIITIMGVSTYLVESYDIPTRRIISDRYFEQEAGGVLQGTGSTRILAFTIFNKLFWKNPIFGNGSSEIGIGVTEKGDVELRRLLGGRSSQIHVGYLSVLYYYGLIGGVLFLSFIFLIVKKLLRDAKLTHHWGPFYGFVGFFVANLTLVEFSFFYAGLIMCLLLNKYYLDMFHRIENKC